VGIACSGGATKAVRSAVEVNGRNGAPVVRGGEEEVEELQGNVVKLEVRSIGVEKGHRKESDEDRGSPAKGVTVVRSFWWLGCRRAVKGLLSSFYWTRWCCWYPWWGAEGLCGGASTVRPSGGGTKACRRCGG
jgi:hypothetical protein